MSGFIDVPAADALWLRNARASRSLFTAAPALPADRDDTVLVDLRIGDGRIAAIEPGGGARDGIVVELDGGQVWPGFVDLHTHLDKGHIWPRRQNADGSFRGALEGVADDRSARWTEEDVLARMDFGVRCALAHGTTAIRTHIDSMGAQGPISWRAFRALRERWAGRMALQAVNLVPLDYFLTDAASALADLVADSGGILGGVTRTTGGVHDRLADDFDAQLDRIIRFAIDRGLDLDFHVDESGSLEARALIRIARAALRHRFKGRILCGHCCSLSLQPDDVIGETLKACADAGIGVVSLPMCNMYLQARAPGVTPRWRGVTLLHEMRATGLSVAVASDNCRDPFYAYGDHDVLEVFTQAVRIAHLDHPFGAWPRAVTTTPADLMGLAGLGRLAVGAPADLVLFRARFFSELLSRPQADRVVLRAGRLERSGLPDYRELDPLMAFER
jgi:cytosine deaminase